MKFGILYELQLPKPWDNNAKAWGQMSSMAYNAPSTRNTPTCSSPTLIDPGSSSVISPSSATLCQLPDMSYI